jgi:hypothetical protein
MMVDTQWLHLSLNVINIHMVAGLFGGAVILSVSPAQVHQGREK